MDKYLQMLIPCCCLLMLNLKISGLQLHVPREEILQAERVKFD